MIYRLTYKFLDTIPNELEEGILYISIRFRVAMHLCCCGCKNKVVTPLSPVQWKLVFDGKSVSLYPSIGNWNFECRSHYWINNSKVEWARQWPAEEVDASKKWRKKMRAEYFNIENSMSKMNYKKTKQKKSLIIIITTWFKNLFS